MERLGTHPLIWLLAAAGTGIIALGASTVPAGTNVLALGLVLVGVGVVVGAALTKPRGTLVASFLLLAFVRIEPAPVDLMLAVLVGASIALGTARVRVPIGMVFLSGLFMASSTLSMVNAREFGTAIFFNGVTVFLLVVALWLPAVLAPDGRTTRRAVKAYVAGAVVTSVAAVLALHLSLPGGDVLLFDQFRIQGLFKDPNVFAPFLVPAACILLEEIGRPRLLQWSRLAVAAAALAVIAGIVFAFSRAAWLNFLVAAAVLIMVYTLRRRGLAVAARSSAFLLVAGLLGVAALVGTGSLSFFESRTGLQQYDEQRFETQGQAYSRTTDHVLGYGAGQSEGLLGKAPHSTYARVGIEQGIPGLLVIIAIFAATLSAAVRLAARDAELHGIGSASLLAVWVGLLANSFFIDTLHWRHLWIFAALVWCAAVSTRGRPPHSRYGAWSERPRAAASRPARSSASPYPGVTGRRGAGV